MPSTSTRKTVIWIASVVVLSVVLLVFTNPWSTMRNNVRQVALKSPAEVDRIILADAFDSTVLVRQNDTWLLNGKEEAGKVPVENLLIAAERMEISSFISSESLNGARQTGTSPTRTISFFKGEKKVLSYELQAKDKQYLITPPGSGNSYFVKVSGYPGLNLIKVFSSAPNHYREHLLIDLLPSEISRIEIELQDGAGFHFEQDQEGNITCFSSNNQDPLPAGELNHQAIRLLFSYFTSIVFEDRSGMMEEDLFQARPPVHRMARLHVESHNGEKHSLQVFPYVENQGEEAHMFKALVLYNNDPEALIVNYIYLDVIMRDLSRYVGDK